MSRLISAGSDPSLLEKLLEELLFTHLPVDAKCEGGGGGKDKSVEWTIWKNKTASFHEREKGGGGGGGLGRRAPLEIRQENRRVESYLEEARISPPSIALALSDMVMLIGDTGEGGHCTSMPQNITAPGPR